ncbi:putative RNA methyltransferase [Williamsia sterculiae]|uniref:23S rRNA m(1)G-748 methyltransferase n=1 Tax=Williamsia sterculiae TaxID=1344003 RepID=A0A1N7FR73_9NOCA|nr:hypothetical protein [Williamsia sterculiae]SIS02800.1 23S rRNA m(1)G-748 methyltransferase [Williamsia sterculiae]
MAPGAMSLAQVYDLLRCPVCADLFDLDDRTLLCARGHAFDIARQGYVSLLSGRQVVGLRADTADMLDARDRVMRAGLLDPIRDRVAASCVGTTTLEVGAGTGHYLAGCVQAGPDGSRGVGIDLSKVSARRVARIHPDVGAVVADAWKPWPIGDHVVHTVLSVFSPRNTEQCRRVLTDDGALVMVTPTDRHLHELIEPMGMIGVDEEKTQRIDSAVHGVFDRWERNRVEYTVAVPRSGVIDLVRMGPSAFHRSDAEIVGRAARLPDVVDVTFSVVHSVFVPAPAPAEPNAVQRTES